jgi:predicted dehydrogenase
VRILIAGGDWIAGGFNDLISVDGPYPPLEYDQPASDLDEATHNKLRGFLNSYSHELNLLRYLLGEPYRPTYADPQGRLMVGQAAGGAACVLELVPYQPVTVWHESALICFEKGYLRLDLPAPLASNRPGQVELFRDLGGGAQAQTLVPQLPWVGAMRQQAINFVAALRGEARPPCEAADALEDLRVAREYFRLLGH